MIYNSIEKFSSLVTFGFFFLLHSVIGSAQNPIIQSIYATDPSPLVHKDTLFLYTGHDENKSTWFVMKDWHVYSTTDIVNWLERGSPLSVKTFNWVEKDGKPESYFLFRICV